MEMLGTRAVAWYHTASIPTLETKELDPAYLQT